MGRPAQSELTKLRIVVAKGSEVELLEGDEQTCILATSLGTSLSPIAPEAHLSSEHLQLFTSVLKRLASFLRPSISTSSAPPSDSSTFSPNPEVVALSECLFIAEKQLQIGQLLSTGLDSSHRGLNSDATASLDALVALAGAQLAFDQLSADSEDVPLTPLLAPLALQALRSPLLTKPPLLLLSSLLPTLPTSFLQAHAPNLLQQLLQQSSERHLAQARGKLLAVLIGHHLDSPPSDSTQTSSELQTFLLRALLIDDPILRLNINQTTLRPLAEKHPRFIAELVNRLAGGEEEFAKHERMEEAWLSLVTLGNAISLCEDIASSSALTEKEGEGGGGEKIALPLEVVLGCLSHPSSAVKLGAFSLVTDKPAIKSPLSEGEVVVVKRFLEAAINTGESDFRHSIVGRVAKLVVRIKASTFASNRDLVKLRALADPKTPAESVLIASFEKTLEISKDLLIWLTTFLTSQIRPAASHSRTILSLRLLQGLFASELFSDINSGSSFSADAPPSHGSKTQRALPQTFPFQLVFFTPQRVRSFIGCLLSTYAEVRVLAVELLEQGPSPLPGLDTPEKIDSLDKEARGSYLSNPRGSQGHAGALALRLVFGLRFGLNRGKEVDLVGQAAFVNVLLDEIDSRLQLSRTNVILASSSHPVHGLLQALQEILALLDPTSFPEVFHRTLRTIALTWECTRDVLSSTAASTAGADDEVVPDHEIARAIAKAGEVSEEGTTSGGESGPVYQVILSWAWRAVKESSALLSAIFVRPLQESFKNKSSSIWTSTHLEEGGQLFIALLSEIRHPGAFLHIYPEYSKLVEAIVRNTSEKDEESRKLPEEWLQIHLEALNVEHHTAGRRSAGLPFGILAVLLGQPKLVPAALEALLKLSASESSEVVVTAMNALKVVMSESKLSSSVSSFFERAVITALESLSSSDWAVRNVGLLLIGALVRKAFDAKKSQASESILSRDSLSTWSSKYPQLLPLFLRTLQDLESDDKLKRSEGAVFAVLQVLRNLQASDPPSEEQTAFVAVLERLSGSRQLDVREAAAHALPAVITRSSLGSYLPEAIANARSSKTQNELHGRLLQLLVLVRDVARPFDPIFQHHDFVLALIDSIPQLLLENRCRPTQGLFVQLVGAVKIASGENFKGRTFDEVDQFCQDQIQSREASLGVVAPVGDDFLKLACARYVLNEATTDRFEALIKTTDEVAEIALLRLEDQDEPLPPPLANLISPIAFAKSTSQRCRQPALRLLASSPSSSLGGDASTRWDGLMEEFESSTCQPFKEALLPVLGTLAQGSDSETTSTRLARLLKIVGSSSEETESEDMRFAALTSLSNFTSILFKTAQPSHPYELRLQGHQLVLRLLQDDEYGVRLLAATLVGRVLGIREDGLDQEVALMKWWEFISEQGRGEVRWKEEVWKMVESGMSDALDLTTLRTTSILFATEAPNTFREPELDIRAAASSLQNRLEGEEVDVDKVQLSTLRSAISQLEAASKEGGDLWLDPASAVLHLRTLQVRLAVDALKKGGKGEGEEVLELEKMIEELRLDI